MLETKLVTEKQTNLFDFRKDLSFIDACTFFDKTVKYFSSSENSDFLSIVNNYLDRELYTKTKIFLEIYNNYDISKKCKNSLVI